MAASAAFSAVAAEFFAPQFFLWSRCNFPVTTRSLPLSLKFFAFSSFPAHKARLDETSIRGFEFAKSACGLSLELPPPGLVEPGDRSSKALSTM